MSKPTEHKTVQARILAYAEAIGWTIVSREEAERRRGFEPQMTQMGTDEESQENHLRKSADHRFSDGKGLSLFFDDLLDAKVREFNPRYAEAEGALLGQFRHSTRTSTATGNSSSTCATGENFSTTRRSASAT